ncbi:MAG: recombinase family protein [Lewinellaceae bacterium]|nr:recombinase family protein [Phaeodactylibacter sp.]MCB9035867.1 recombinase family protein [Lewinellaceae bacterium]
MLIGYARVSTFDQNLDLQQDALKKAGCDRVIVDTASGKNAERPGLNTIKEILRQGDTLVVWRLDRLGRSLQGLIGWINYLDQKEVAFRSLQESIDTTTPTGKLVFHIFGALAEFERHLIQERTQAGLAAARARGRLGGRPMSLNEDKRKTVAQLYEDGKLQVMEICEMFGISKPTLYKYVAEAKANKMNSAK